MYQRIYSWLLAVVLGLAAPLAVVAPLGLTPALALAGLASLPALLRRRRLDGLGLWLVVAVGWCLVSALWSDRPQDSFSGAVTLGLTVLCGYAVWQGAAALPAGDRRRVALALVAGVALALALLLGRILYVHGWFPADFDRQVQLSRHSRGIIVTCLLAPAAVAALWSRSRPAAVVLAAAALGCAWFGGTGSAKLAVLLAVVGALSGWFLPRMAAVIGALSVVVAVVVMPWPWTQWSSPQQMADALSGLSPSALHRTVIWQFTAANIEQRPLLGWGFEASRWIPHADDEELIRFQGPAGAGAFLAAKLPLHPHNVVLQWWLELGVVGAALLASGAVALMWNCRTLSPRRRRALAFGVAAAVAGVAMISFGAWQKWWVAAVWLIALATELSGDETG